MINPQSATSRITALVTQLGEATPSMLAVHLPDLDHRQILQALANCKDAGRVRVKVRGSFRGGRETVWEAQAHVPRVRKKPQPATRPASSVFALATPEPRGVWPPLERGRVFNLLGDWA